MVVNIKVMKKTIDIKNKKIINKILKSFEKHKGEFVIDGYSQTVVRLVAIGEDEDDIYYVFYDGQNLQWCSCLVNYIILKGKIDNKNYNEFIRLAYLNHLDKVEFEGHKIEKHIKDLSKVREPNKYLTDICWEIN